jgi:hypothetical protein
MGKDPDRLFLQAKILIQRLGRLSADSFWAHRASGVRASLDKFLAGIEKGDGFMRADLEALIQSGFELLEKAAREIPSPEEILNDSLKIDK